ncbi:MAG: TatD family hydrolase [Nitrososphaeraceae archaeon]|nr:TatD family hydrolase [Nitrososphaeraceae archaeon]
MEYFDSHIHLTDLQYSDYLEHILFALRCMKIKACSVTVDLDTTKKSFDMFCNASDIVSQFVGIHPEYISDEDFEIFKILIEKNLDKVDGIGEIGLDPTYSASNENRYKIQIRNFECLLSLAEKYYKPVSIHSRNSLVDVLQILPSYRINNKLLHWFAGSKKQLKTAMEMDCFVSYGPVLLYSTDKKVLLSNTLEEKILVETDGPVRYSKCFNHLPVSSISALLSVINSVSEGVNLNFYDTAKLLKRNSENFLGKKI